MNRSTLFWPIVIFLLMPESSSAFQSHPAPEGLYVHQLAHVVFIFSMAVLAYWLEQNKLTAHRGWRFIQAACVLFIAWNLVAFAGHWVEEQIPDTSVTGEPGWSQRIVFSASPWVPVYYVLKLDHLVSVPATVFLLLGIRRLYKDATSQESRSDE